MDDLILTKIDPNKYAWKNLPPMHGAEGRIRLLAGGEIVQDILNRYNKGFQTLFFAFNVDFVSQHPAASVTEAARDAWIKLRYLVPTIASLVVIDDHDIPSLQYYSASVSGVSEWASQTLLVHQGSSEIDLNTLRRDIGQSKVPSEHGQQTWMHISMASTSMISKVGFILHTHHSPFDGTAVKILSNIYLKEFAKALGGAKVTNELDWGSEVDNLLPTVFNVLLPNEPMPIHPSSSEVPTFNHPFYATTQKVIQAFANNSQNAYNLRPRKGDPGWPLTCCEEVVFSKEESEAFMKKLKGVTQSYTVTHAAHAALVMVNIFDNPPTHENSSKAVSCEFIVNSRRYLQQSYSDREGYPGYALSVVPHGFPLTMFLSQSGEALPLDKSMLVTLMRRAREIYNGLREMPAALSFMIPVSDIFSSLLKQLATANPPPENAFRISHDGAGEAFIDHEFQDTSGHANITVSKFFTSVNRTDPAPFFRVSSWDGVIDLRADYNANIISHADVKAYLEKWKEFMLLAFELTANDY